MRKCKVCESEKDLKRKFYFTAKGEKIIEYICKDCDKKKWNKFYDEMRVYKT